MPNKIREIDPLKTHSDSISIEALMSAPKDLISVFEFDWIFITHYIFNI